MRVAATPTAFAARSAVIAALASPKTFTRLLRKTLDRMGLTDPESPDLKGVKIPK